jgi:very-short-patch-repair endonuclease
MRTFAKTTEVCFGIPTQIGGVMTFWRAQQARKSNNASQLTRMSRSQDGSVRAEVARNIHTPLHVLEQLACDENTTVRMAVAGNPNASMALLTAMIKNPYQTNTPVPEWFKVPQEYLDGIAQGKIKRPVRSDNAVWEIIANRNDLTLEVITQFGEISAQQARSFLREYLMHIRIVENCYEVDKVNPMVFEVLAAIPDTLKHLPMVPTFELQYALGEGSIQTVIASLGWAGRTPLNDETALIIATCDEVAAHQALVATFGRNLPHDAAVALSNSDDWKVLSALDKCLSLSEEEKRPIIERLKALPEWKEFEEERRRIQQLEIEVLNKKRILQEGALPSRDFDSPVEEVFWEAYIKNPPPSLKGLVTQHVVGKYRLDFAIPEKNIGIELDGFDHHSSRDDLVRDRQRQRDLEQQGWRIVRFAAKEVFENPESCVNQTANWVSSQ